MTVRDAAEAMGVDFRRLYNVSAILQGVNLVEKDDGYASGCGVRWVGDVGPRGNPAECKVLTHLVINLDRFAWFLKIMTHSNLVINDHES